MEETRSEPRSTGSTEVAPPESTPESSPEGSDESYMDIGYAVCAMHNGVRVTRAGWNGKDMYLELQVPDENSKMTEPYVYMKTAQGGLIPWLCSQADLLANDWVIIE